jgi:hypothetical protein
MRLKEPKDSSKYPRDTINTVAELKKETCPHRDMVPSNCIVSN